MFQKKPIYIVGLVIFTLILIADLALFFLVPQSGAGGGLPEFYGGGASGQLPGNFNSGEGDFQIPEGFSGRLPEGFAEGNASGERPVRDQSGKDALAQQAGLTQSAQSGILQQLRSLFWPVLILCVLADGLCVFMLVRISKKQSPEAEPVEEEFTARRDHGNVWLTLIALALVAGLFLSGIPTATVATQRQAQTTVLQDQATLGQIVSLFSGSGTLTAGQAQTLQIPATVKVNAYTVRNGDQVDTGDVIALVDRVSVQKAMYEVHTLIGEMDEEIAEIKDDTLDDQVTAPADGRIKGIYVAVGDSIADAMHANGALLLISLGGSMTVEIQCDQALAVGQSLVVTLSDGTQIQGKVQQNQQGKVTVTTTDDGPAHADLVTVSLEDGTLLDTGTLLVSSPLKVAAYAGTVKRVRVALNAKVSVDDVLLTLEDTQDVARYEQLLALREELTDTLTQLNRMYQEGCVRADSSGIVSGVDETVDHTQLSYIGGAAGGSNSQAASLPWSTRLFAERLISQGRISATEQSPGQTTPPEQTTPPAGEVPAETTGPESSTEPPVEAPLSGTFAGKISKVTYGALHFQILRQDVAAMEISELEAMDEALFTSAQQYSPALDVPVNRYLDGQLVPSTVQALQAGDKVLLQLEEGEVVRIDYIAAATEDRPGQPTQPGMSQTPSFSGGSGNQQASPEDSELATYQVEQVALCAITPARTMTIAVSVDELDILSLSVGQQAAITLDAIPGQSFSGQVSRIDTAGTNAGGSTKYTVTLELERQEQMLDGMNASVTVEVGKTDNVLTVLAAAVYEDGARAYVYTALDSETGQPTTAVDVQTGISDGTVIQILSGLSVGDSVYYAYADTITYQLNP